MHGYRRARRKYFRVAAQSHNVWYSRIKISVKKESFARVFRRIVHVLFSAQSPQLRVDLMNRAPSRHVASLRAKSRKTDFSNGEHVFNVTFSARNNLSESVRLVRFQSTLYLLSALTISFSNDIGESVGA